MISPIAAAQLAAIDGPGDMVPIASKNNRTPLDDLADIRDSLGVIVGGGHKNFLNDDARANMLRLRAVLGEDQANKLINHAILFNNRDDIQNKSPQERLAIFYNLAHPDKNINGLLERVKSFGSGPQAGLNDSVNVADRALVGDKLKVPTTPGMLVGMSGIPIR